MSALQIIFIVLVSFFCGALLSFLVYFHMLNSKKKKQASKVLEDMFSQFGVDLNEKKDVISIDFSELGSDLDSTDVCSDCQFISECKPE